MTSVGVNFLMIYSLYVIPYCIEKFFYIIIISMFYFSFYFLELIDVGVCCAELMINILIQSVHYLV